ncbi:Pectinesterase 2 [Colletotrichum chlorophyti]|uniref:Pectinesterase n=1 Tax=Colletotrichum chlorophyti TaxID=708187 RepID=A0A1Q8RR96_9PEZI|nr:Pectinesterase 2 [Colletotrichum chlorophyti]
MLSLLLLGYGAAHALAASRTSAPSGSITVCTTGGCNFSHIQDAVNSISTSSTSAHSIFIHAGNYQEQVVIPALSGKLNIYGYTTDTSDYTNNVVNILHNSSIKSGAADDEHSAALINGSPNVAIYNINIKNTYGQGSQAIALAAYNTKQGYYGVGLYGYQDTLLAQVGNQVYGKCYIEGAVDFIFGQHARIWVTKSDIRVSAGGGSITADAPSSSSDQSFFVIDHSTVDAKTGSSVSPGSVYLGRPWSEYARVCFQETSLSGIINSAGWTVWNPTDPRTDHVTYEEYLNTGAGAKGKRSFGKSLSSAISIGTILGSDYSSWVDSSYI